MTWKPGIAIALTSFFLAGTALAQAPGSGSGTGPGGTSGGSPGSSASPGGGSPTPGTPGTSPTPGSSPSTTNQSRDLSNNPCPPGQSQEKTNQPCAPTRNMPGQASQPKSMERMDKQVGSAAQNGRQAMGQQHVRSVQEALKDKGYDPGTIDGAMGPQTAAALREFQKAEGLQSTGRVDAETRSKLGI